MCVFSVEVMWSFIGCVVYVLAERCYELCVFLRDRFVMKKLARRLRSSALENLRVLYLTLLPSTENAGKMGSLLEAELQVSYDALIWRLPKMCWLLYIGFIDKAI